MSRFLFVVPPLVGHVNPTVAVAAELTARGHSVAWAGVPEVVAPLVGPDAVVLRCAGPDLTHAAAIRPADARGPLAFKFLWEGFLIPLAEAMIPGVEHAVQSFHPDVLVVDQQAVAGAVVAERLGLPWATSATTSAELTEPLAGMPKVAAWVRELLLTLEERFGKPDPARYERPLGDLRFSPHLVLAYSTEQLAGVPDGLGSELRFVGPSLAPRPTPVEFPWGFLDGGGAAVLVSLGTANADAGERFLTAAAEAIAARPRLRGVVVDPAGRVALDAENLLVRRYVPQLELLSRVSAVICHGGHNTVCETLFHDLPLVIAPIRDDQPIVAQQVVAAGAGLRLRFGRAGAERIGSALDAVLTDEAFADAAARIGQSFRLAGGARSAADALLELR